MLETKKTEKGTQLEKPVSAPVARTPFSFMRRFTEDMERMFEDFEDFRFPRMFGKEFFPFRMEMKDVGWLPEIEVAQTDDFLTVRCDLPGMKKEDIKLELTDKFLTISGERNEEKKEEREGYFHTERSYGSFYRQVPLPAGAKPETTEATFKDGVLEIKMPAIKKEPTGRRLEIKEPETAKAAKAT